MVPTSLMLGGRRVAGFGLSLPSASDQQAAIDAANAAVAALNADANYCNTVCQSGTATNTAVHNFKVAWNQYQQSQQAPTTLPYNGQYDQTTEAAIISLGISPPSQCTSTCSTGGGGPTPTPQPPTPTPAPTTSSSSNGALVAGAILVGGGIVAVAYAVRKRRHH